jgi:hypothetical protein
MTGGDMSLDTIIEMSRNGYRTNTPECKCGMMLCIERFTFMQYNISYCENYLVGMFLLNVSVNLIRFCIEHYISAVQIIKKINLNDFVLNL